MFQLRKATASLALGLCLLGSHAQGFAQTALFTTGYCGGFLLRTSGLIQAQSPKAGFDNEVMERVEKAFFNAGSLLMIRAVIDGSGAKDADRAAAYAVSTLGRDYSPLMDKRTSVHQTAMGCLTFANETVKP